MLPYCILIYLYNFTNIKTSLALSSTCHRMRSASNFLFIGENYYSKVNIKNVNHIIISDDYSFNIYNDDIFKNFKTIKYLRIDFTKIWRFNITIENLHTNYVRYYCNNLMNITNIK